MSSSPEDPPAVVVEPSWFASWQAPNTAIEHPDRWRIVPDPSPSRDVDPADRPAYRARYGRVVFATPDPDTARGSEPEDVVLVRAVMALRGRTQPVITLAPDAAAEIEAMLPGTDTDPGGQRGVVFEAAVLARCAASPWVSDDALAIVEEVQQDLHVERGRLAHFEAEQALLANHPDGTADPVRERRLAELEELVAESRQDVRHVEGEFRQVAEQITHRVAEARAQVIDPLGRALPGLSGPPSVWAPITDAERAALLGYARLYPLAEDWLAARHAFEDHLAAVQALANTDPDQPGLDRGEHRAAVRAADSALVAAGRRLDVAEHTITLAGGEVGPYQGDPHRAVFTKAGQRIVLPDTPRPPVLAPSVSDAAGAALPVDAAGAALRRAERLSHEPVHQRSTGPTPAVAR